MMTDVQARTERVGEGTVQGSAASASAWEWGRNTDERSSMARTGGQ